MTSKPAQETSVRKTSDTIAKFASVIALSAGISGAATILASFLSEDDWVPSTAHVKRRLIDLSHDLNVVRARQEKLEKRLVARVKSSPDTAIASLQSDVADTRSRLELLEKALLPNPERALSVPLLRKDVETLQADAVRNREETEKVVDRIYDQNKWFIGLMFSMAVGLIGLAVSNFFQLRKGS